MRVVARRKNMKSQRSDTKPALSLGFPPLAATNARVLVLGSLPGPKSLETCEYYADARNAFWKIAARWIGHLPASYALRAGRLTQQGIAIWDVLAAATRSGASDSKIRKDAIANNFRAFFHAHPRLQLLAFNGQKPAKLYQRHVFPTLCGVHRAIPSVVLPSTSGAHARDVAQKSKEWGVVWSVGRRKSRRRTQPPKPR